MRRLSARAARFAPYTFRVNWFLVAALAVALAAALPLLWQPGLLNTRGGGDSPFLLQRLHQLETALRDGHFPARWMPDANYGYGYPFYNFYAPLSIYITLLFRLFGFSFVRAIQLSQLAGFLVAAWGIFLLARRWWRSEWAALLTAVAYTAAPFHLVNVYVRGDSLAEFWAMAFYPWLLLAVEGVLGDRDPERDVAVQTLPRRRVVGLALAYAALILSHNISALIFSPFLLLYILLRLFSQAPSFSTSSFLRPVAALFLALALAAWFFVPALAEQNLAQLGPVTEGYFHYSNHFRGADLVQGRFLFDYDPKGGQAFRMGLVQAVTAVAGLLLLWTYWRQDRQSRPFILFVTLALLVATLMMTPASRLLWQYLPLLSFTQFPWRFLSVQAFAGALAAGGLALLPRRAWMVSLTAVLLLVGGLGRLKTDHLILNDGDVTAVRLAQYEWFTGNIGTTVSAEYLPSTVNPRPVTSAWLEQGNRDRLQVLTGEVTEAGVTERRATGQTWQIETAVDSQIMFPTLYWPGWEAIIDGNEAAIAPAPGSGLITLTLPQGRHAVTLRLTRTPIRLAAELLSLAALCLAIWLLRPARWVRPHRMTGGALALAAVALLLLSATVRLWPRLNRPDTDLTWDFAQMGYLHHAAAGVTFTNGLRLTQYTYAQDVARPGSTVHLTLHVPDAQGEAATLALTTPAIHRFPAAPVLAELTQPLSARTTFSLTLPANTPAGLVVPRLTIGESAALLPSGGARGDLFLRPLRITAAGGFIAGQTKPLDVRLLDQELSHSGDGRNWLLKLSWYTVQPLSPDYNVSLHLLDDAGEVITQFDTQPGYGFRPSSQWPAGRWVNDWLVLPLPVDLPVRSELMVQLYEVGGETVLRRHLGTLTAGAFHPREPIFTLPNGVTPATAVFHAGDSDLIQWRGYTVTQSNGLAFVTLYWEAVGVIPVDYTRFLHLLDETGSLVQQNDAMPQANSYPTSQWTPGEIVADRVVLDLHNLPPGTYDLQAGFYENLGDAFPRLAVMDGEGAGGTAVLLPEKIVVR